MESFGEILTLVKEYCKEQISETAYALWIRDIEPVKMEGGGVTLFVRSEFKRNILTEKYTPLLTEAFNHILGFDTEIQILCETEPPQPPKEDIFSGDYAYTFDTFIVGSSNKFAHAASLAVAQNPSVAYNPLFIYGPSGLGKTHLLNAISTYIKEQHPDFNILYVKAEAFTNELIDGIQQKSTAAFHNKYRSVDVLLVDDVQFIAGKDSTQEEFFHTFDSLHQAGKQIVLTSDRPPKEIKTLEDRLRTRFEVGLLADIQPPDFETRIAIIRRKAELLGIEIEDDVAQYIANKLKNNIRQLEGVVKKIKAMKTVDNSTPPIIMAQIAIREILNDNQPVPVTIDKILSEVARTFSVTAAEIKSKKRSANISNARQAAAYIIKEITQLPYVQIGESLGDRNHSTISYAVKQVEDMMPVDSKYRETIEDIIKNIRDL